MKNALIFGASGAIGFEIYNIFIKNQYNTIGTTREVKDGFFTYNPFGSEKSLPKLKFDAICFAQGLNFNDNIITFDEEKHLEMYKANCLFILSAIHSLLESNSLNNFCKITIISSIWQESARSNKLSYCVTKSALKGLVNSLALDLGNKSILVNAILPGAIDNKMTRENLSQPQIETICKLTPTQNLSKISDIVELIMFLSSDKNTNITNQFITVDGGFSNAKFF